MICTAAGFADSGCVHLLEVVAVSGAFATFTVSGTASDGAAGVVASAAGAGAATVALLVRGPHKC